MRGDYYTSIIKNQLLPGRFCADPGTDITQIGGPNDRKNSIGLFF